MNQYQLEELKKIAAAQKDYEILEMGSEDEAITVGEKRKGSGQLTDSRVKKLKTKD